VGVVGISTHISTSMAGWNKPRGTLVQSREKHPDFSADNQVFKTQQYFRT